MSIVVGDNFDYKAGKPLDGRAVYSTLADMKAVADSTMYNGCIAYCVATDKTYQWKSSNTVDPDTGKWREFTTGSSIEVDDEIDEESTNPVQNAVIAEALDAKQDAADKMTASDMDDVITPLPSVMSRYPVLFDESGAERQVGWYKLANGTKKPVYEISVIDTFPVISTDGATKSKSISIAQPNIIDKVIYFFVQHSWINDDYIGTLNDSYPANIGDERAYVFCRNYINKSTGELFIQSDRTVFSENPFSATIQYTKTTD